MSQRSFKIKIETNDEARNNDISFDGIITDYSNEFNELFQDFNFDHNIKIKHVDDDIYLIEYPENDIEKMYKYLCDNDNISNDEKCEKLNYLFANPEDTEWWNIFGLRAEII